MNSNDGTYCFIVLAPIYCVIVCHWRIKFLLLLLIVSVSLFDQNLKASGTTHYGSALKTAFKYFTNTADNVTIDGLERG